jgi:hypothetical protein
MFGYFVWDVPLGSICTYHLATFEFSIVSVLKDADSSGQGNTTCIADMI